MIKFLKLKKRQRKENDKNKKEENIIKIEESKDKGEEIVPKFNENERKVLEYTLRLDLNRIQKNIDSKVK